MTGKSIMAEEPSLLPILSYGSGMLKRISDRKLTLLRLPLVLPHGVYADR